MCPSGSYQGCKAYTACVLLGVGRVMVHQSFEKVAGSVPAAVGQQGWILTPHQHHLVLLCPDVIALPSAATKKHTTLHVDNLIEHIFLKM